MAKISLSMLYDAMKKVADAVTGNRMQVDVKSSELPTGAATAEKQDEQTTELRVLTLKDFATKAKQNEAMAVLEEIYTKLGGTLKTQAEKASTLSATLQNNAGAVGNGTAMNVDGYGVVTLQVISSSFVGTVVFEGSVDGTNYHTVNARDLTTVGRVSQTTVAGLFEIDCRGLQTIRARISARTSGNVTVAGRAEPFAGSPAQTDVQLTGSDVIKGAVQNVAIPGTRVRLPDFSCREVTIIAKTINTGYIYLGGNDVSSTVFGVRLSARDSITLSVNNTNLIYIDASVGGEGISYVAI